MELNSELMWKPDSKKTWNDFYKENKQYLQKTINFDYVVLKKFLEPMGYLPIFTDGSFVWLFRHFQGVATLDLVKVEKGNAFKIEMYILNEAERKILTLMALSVKMNDKVLTKQQKFDLPKPIKTMLHYGFNLTSINKTNDYGIWTLIKHDHEFWTISRKFLQSKTGVPLKEETTVLPKSVMINIVKYLTQESDHEKEYIKANGLLNRREMLLADCGVFPKDYNFGFRQFKTAFIEAEGLLEDYKKYIKEKNLEDNYESCSIFYKTKVKEWEKKEIK